MTSQGRACPVNVGVSPPKYPNKVGTARTHTHTHTHTHTFTVVVNFCTEGKYKRIQQDGCLDRSSR